MKAQQKEDQKFKLYRLAQIKHYRVDKMLKIQMSEEEREGMVPKAGYGGLCKEEFWNVRREGTGRSSGRDAAGGKTPDETVSY